MMAQFGSKTVNIKIYIQCRYKVDRTEKTEWNFSVWRQQSSRSIRNVTALLCAWLWKTETHAHFYCFQIAAGHIMNWVSWYTAVSWWQWVFWPELLVAYKEINNVERIAGLCLHSPTSYYGHRTEAVLRCTSQCLCHPSLFGVTSFVSISA